MFSLLALLGGEPCGAQPFHDAGDRLVEDEAADHQLPPAGGDQRLAPGELGGLLLA